jgi:hypothetical protein
MPTPTNPKLKTFFGNVLLYTMSLGSSPKISQPSLTRRVNPLRRHVSVIQIYFSMRKSME